MKKLSLAYFGTPDFSARFLEKLLNDKDIPVEVKVVVTQPDKKVGRKQIVTQSPVKVVAEKNGIRVIPSGSEESSLRFTRSLTSVRDDLKNIDLALLFAYGEIIPKEILELPKHGFWNIHPSLLPKYRGASPVAFPLIESEKKTGVTIIQMDEKMDHGPIIAQQKVTIFEKERKPELTLRLSDIAFKLFKNVILNLVQDPSTPFRTNLQIPDQVGNDKKADSGQAPTLRTVSGQARMTIKTIPQDHSKATYTELLTKQDGYIEFSKFKDQLSNSPRELFNKFRGLYPWPGLWTEVEINGKKKRLKITDMDLIEAKLILKKVQLEGKKEVDFEQVNEAYKLF